MTATGGGENVLVARSITKRFGGLVALREIEFAIPRGSIVSLIGPNGAGKTTFFNVVAGLIPPTSGSVELGGARLIAPSVRVWLEPILWFLPPLLVILLGTLVAAGSIQAVAIWGLLGLLLATLILPTAMARPSWYEAGIRRLGIFRSARPNDIVRAGVGRTFQNIRLFKNMSAIENVLVGMHLKLKSNPLDILLSTRRQRVEEVDASQRAEAKRLPGTCRTATSAGSRLRARWPASRCCSSSTSRPPA